jgi:hypothetical protein
MKLTFSENNRDTGEINFSEGRISRISRLTPTIVNITPLYAPERVRVESFIQKVYAESYNAKIIVNYPILMSVRDVAGNIMAAVGFRPAMKEPLFLEQYIGSPIEESLSAVYSKKIQRDQIAEIGNLASAGGGASIFLFMAMASHLNNIGISHAVVTGTDYLHKKFIQLGLNPQKICDAAPEAVSRNIDKWGSYYETNPRVLVGSIPDGIVRLKTALGVEYTPLIPRLHYRYPYV